LKLLPAGFRTNPVFGDMGCGPLRSIVGQMVREVSGARAAEGGVRSDTGALVRISRFRLRYSRIHAALRAGSR